LSSRFTTVLGADMFRTLIAVALTAAPSIGSMAFGGDESCGSRPSGCGCPAVCTPCCPQPCCPAPHEFALFHHLCCHQAAAPPPAVMVQSMPVVLSPQVFTTSGIAVNSASLASFNPVALNVSSTAGASTNLNQIVNDAVAKAIDARLNNAAATTASASSQVDCSALDKRLSELTLRVNGLTTKVKELTDQHQTTLETHQNALKKLFEIEQKTDPNLKNPFLESMPTPPPVQPNGH
jgi:hypothetical protein